MKELGSGFYLGNDGKIYKLVQASREDLEGHIILSQTSGEDPEDFIILRQTTGEDPEGYIVLSQTKQTSTPVQDRDSASYTAESVHNIDKFPKVHKNT